ncbi:PREDICTED: semaphorin-5A-like [Priapulus caudatus]|uniref:Semaphorin-5A-like n=1 Tax=Priapulus caudatus TaxID=37621 RepID=A0ABM1E8L5_PRICU|nr:PREDICTED: semaphorin-5A-like [Priapulus caudatus]XP_014668537.1 PREDICTED: semaphorin-5A-like [Priapulus caudatus]
MRVHFACCAVTVNAGMQSLVLILIGLATLGQCIRRELEHSAHDFTLVPHDELAKNIKYTFRARGVHNYTQLTFDLPRRQLLVGARNFLFRVNLTTLEIHESAEWSPSDEQTHMCTQKGQTDEKCHNFVRVLLIHKDSVFTCGTNAFKPMCSWREIERLNAVSEWVDGIAKCPYSLEQNSTALFTSDGDYYGATVLDFTARDPAIYRIMGDPPYLRTAQYNDKWLNDPDFVASFEIGNFTYFFFREIASESAGCSKTVYSRVARLCKKDKGGNLLMADTWTTFAKVRLNCSLPTEIVFYFDQIQDVFFHALQRRFYAVFTTQVSSIFGSAVCAFDMEALEDAFAGPFSYQKDMHSQWEQVPNLQQLECGAGTERSTRAYMERQKYQLMYLAAQPTQPTPLYTTEMERFSHVVVDNVEIKGGELVDVMFVATEAGTIKKLVKLSHLEHACLVEELMLFPVDAPQRVYVLKLLSSEGALYVGTDEGVIKIDVERCDRFKTRGECSPTSQDPYCGWNSRLSKCTRAPAGNTRSPYWLQDIHACPDTSEPVNGGFGPWNDWTKCNHVGVLSPGEECLCRMRDCNDPPPANGGKNCRGQRVQVSNCTTHGGWTPWSEWSACSLSCGRAMKTRHRRCGNPEPRFGGRVCVGKETEEDACDYVPCPVLPPPKQDGGWSPWSAWSRCSAECGGGMRKRSRTCDSPEPRYNGLPCSGCDVQFSPCSEEPCQEVKKSTPWTLWGKNNVTKDGYFEQRFRFTCHAEVPDASLMRIGNMRKQERFCVDGARSCLNSAFINNDGEWSSWQEWSSCTAECGGGVQTRSRDCNSPKPVGSGTDCEGYGLMQRQCNMHSCQGEWSCWSPWSECSVTCSTGTRRRTRECRTSGSQERTTACIGKSRDEEICEMAPCELEIGWHQWSAWSLCDGDNNRHRTRVCKEAEPNATQCLGPGDDTRACSFTPIVQESRSPGGAGIAVMHLAIASCVAFVVGCAISIVVITWYQRRQRGEPNRESAINKADLFMPVNLEWKNNETPLAGTTYRNAPVTRNGSMLRNGTIVSGGGGGGGTLPRGPTITRGQSLTRKTNPYGTLQRMTVKTPAETESFKRVSMMKDYDQI